MKLLINESPLQVLPSLAVAIGLNEAIILQQIHYWLNRSSVEHENKKWVYNTLEEWKKQFPFFSQSTLKRTLKNLKDLKIVEAKKLSKDKFDKTLYYTINYEELIKLESPDIGTSADEVNMTQSNDQTTEPIDEVNMTQSRVGQDDLLDEVNMTQSYNVHEITLHEITTETLSPKSSQKNNSKQEIKREINFNSFVSYIRTNYINQLIVRTKDKYTNQQIDISVSTKGYLYDLKSSEDFQGMRAKELWNNLFDLHLREKINLYKKEIAV